MKNRKSFYLHYYYDYEEQDQTSHGTYKLILIKEILCILEELRHVCIIQMEKFLFPALLLAV